MKLSFSVSDGQVNCEGHGVSLWFLPSGRAKQGLSDVGEDAQAMAKRRGFSGKPKALLTYDRDENEHVVVISVSPRRGMFHCLETARKAVAACRKVDPKWVEMNFPEEGLAPLVDAVTSAWVAAGYEGPKYRAKPKEDKSLTKIHFRVPKSQIDLVQSVSEKARLVSEGTNLVRELTTMAGNDLTSARYVALAQEKAKAAGLASEFYSVDRLKEMKAGAFLAVVQGSGNTGAGILKLSYRPKQPKGKIAFVGKGITFDTGGNNIKTGGYMYGMNADMAGSAVALASILYAAKRDWPFEVDAYLAIAENLLGPDSYRPNDVVTALNQKTIEVVDTDAEGRMVLADTLELASQSKPDLIMDFATLTGACVRALGTRYSGAYTNRRKLISGIMSAGRSSGERVWPFPPDKDYGRCLKSQVADIKQCRPSGGVDHIESSYFLSQFVDRKIPWVHVDLSGEENEGGLAHVGGDVTGFGVRFAVAFCERQFHTPL